MGIVFIGIFILTASLLLIRGLKFRTGKAVPVLLCLGVIAIQVVQILGFSLEHFSAIPTVGHIGLSGMFLAGTMLNFSRRKSRHYI